MNRIDITNINTQGPDWLCQTKADPRQHQENTARYETNYTTKTGDTDFKFGRRESI